MKKTMFIFPLFIGLLAFSPGTSHAQKGNPKTGPSAITTLPNIGQGYLILNKADFPKVDYWKTAIIERTFSDASTFSDRKVAETTLEKNKNYQQIPVEYRNPVRNLKYLVQVSGLTKSGEVVVNEPLQQISYGPGEGTDPQLCSGCVQSSVTREWGCNGSTPSLAYTVNGGVRPKTDGSYAWTIFETTNPNTFSRSYTLNSGYHWNAAMSQGLYYYEYISEADFNANCSGTSAFGFRSCNELYGYAIGGGTGSGLNIIGPLNGSTTEYYDVRNHRIFGNVYGIRKDLGPWRESVYEVFNAAYANIPATNVGAMASWFWPQASDFGGTGYAYPALTCNGTQENGAYQKIIHHVWSNFGSMVSLSAVVSIRKELSLISAGLDIDRIIISDLNNVKADAVILDVKKAFNENGEWTGPAVVLNPGLYSVGLALNDGNYIPVVREVEKTTLIKGSQESLLQAQVMPVPIVGEEFKLNLKTSGAVNFSYHLIDFYGNELHTQDFLMHKDEDITVGIRPKKAMQTGMLFHRFVFADGSVKVIQTTRE